MSERKDGGPAFPYEGIDHRVTGPNSWEARNVESAGMSLRDYFAAKALPIVAPLDSPAQCTVHWFVRRESLDELARDAYALADAMLRAREQ